MEQQKELCEALRKAVLNGNVKDAQEIARKIVKKDFSPDGAVEKLYNAMRSVNKLYEQHEYFVVDVASAATAMRKAYEILAPHLKTGKKLLKGKIVIGCLKGTSQGLGKNIVAATLRAAGFTVCDLGENVAPEKFVEAAEEEKAHVIAVSITMDESLPYLQDIMKILDRKKMRPEIGVVVGGRAVSQETCRRFGVDAYALDAWDCVKKVEKLLSSSGTPRQEERR